MSPPFPALALASGTSTNITHSRITGRRRKDAPEPAEPADLWHIGSVTKSMTALLLAKLAHQGHLSLDDPITRHLSAAPGWSAVTLRALMAHHGRLPANPTRQQALAQITNPDARSQIVADALAMPPGPEGFAYSNLGYIALGAAIEAITGATWETTITEEVFAPLGLASAGFGPPPDPGIWGHRRFLRLKTIPVSPSNPGSDNPAFLGPAGTVHLTLADFARYAQSLLRLTTGEDGILPAAAYADAIAPLPGPGKSRYGGGLVQDEDAATGTRLLWHNGSNTLWMAHLALAPKRDRFAVACTNIAGTRADARLAHMTRAAIAQDPT